jgi:hypothetical protein
MDFIVSGLLEAWHLLLRSSLYVLFGRVIAGLITALTPEEVMGRFLGAGLLPCS